MYLGFCYILLASVGTAYSGSNTHFLLFSGGVEEEQTGCLRAWSSTCEDSQLPMVFHCLIDPGSYMQFLHGNRPFAWSKLVLEYTQVGATYITVITLLTTLGPFMLPVSPTSGYKCYPMDLLFSEILQFLIYRDFPFLFLQMTMYIFFYYFYRFGEGKQTGSECLVCLFETAKISFLFF